MRQPFWLWSALYYSIRYLWLHFILAMSVSALLTALAYFKTKRTIEGGVMIWIVNKYLSVFTFSFLGLLVAFFLSRGVDKDGGPNPTLSNIATALIPLITGGIAYLEGGQISEPNQPRAGMAAFLITALVCYQMFYYQISHLYSI